MSAPSAGSSDPAAPRPAAAIHDLGYKRYLGTRRPQLTRWRVIVKNVVATAWRGWWRMKAWMAGAAMTTAAIGVLMYVWLFISENMAREFQRGGAALNWADAILPMSFQFYTWWGFMLGATVAAGQVARDLRAGAFEFYFSRPVRPIDYLVGKLAGTFVVMALGMAAGPFLLALFRVGLSATDSGQLLHHLARVPLAALIGVLASLAYAVVPLALSTLSPRPRITVSIWVVFYFVVGGIAEGLGHGLGVPDLAALNLSHAVARLAFGLFDVPPVQMQPVPSVAASLAALIGYSVLGIILLHARLRRAEQAGMGGG